MRKAYTLGIWMAVWLVLHSVAHSVAVWEDALGVIAVVRKVDLSDLTK